MEQAFTAVAAALRTGVPPAHYPHLRATQVSVAEHLLHPTAGAGGAPPTAPVPAEVVLARETDLMVDALNTIAHLAGVEPASLGAS